MKKKVISKQSQTDWTRLQTMPDKDIDLSDSPELTPELFARAIVRRGLQPVPRKSQLTLRLDQDVLEWFRKQGQGYQTQINALLRAYMNAHKWNRIQHPLRGQLELWFVNMYDGKQHGFHNGSYVENL